MAEPVGTPRRRPGVLLIVILAAIVLAAAGATAVLLNLSGGCGGDDYVNDASSHLCYPIPDGWEKASDGGLKAPESEGAGSFKLEPTPDVLAKIDAGGEQALLEAAKGIARFGNSRADLAVDTESAERVTISGHEAMTASLRYNYTGVPGYRYLRITAVAVDGGWSLLVAMGADSDKAAVDEIHDGLEVLPAGQ